MSMRIKWYPQAHVARMVAKMDQNVLRAAVFLVGDIKRAFPDSGIKNATRAQREANRSKPGEIPHVQTGGGGGLKGSIKYEKVKPTVYKVGPSVRHGIYLERGTMHMAARPFLRPAMSRNRTTLKQFITGKRIT